jgi:hypothetical protein
MKKREAGDEGVVSIALRAALLPAKVVIAAHRTALFTELPSA